MIKQNGSRAIVIIMILMFVFTFVGCGKKGDPVLTKDKLSTAMIDHRIVA